MATIAVRNIPPKWTLPKLVRSLVRIVKGKFHVLHFETNKKSKNKTKTCYLKLSELLNPAVVIENICRADGVHQGMYADIPAKIPQKYTIKNSSGDDPTQFEEGLPSWSDSTWDHDEQIISISNPENLPAEQSASPTTTLSLDKADGVTKNTNSDLTATTQKVPMKNVNFPTNSVHEIVQLSVLDMYRLITEQHNKKNKNLNNTTPHQHRTSVSTLSLAPNPSTGAQIICNSGPVNLTDNTNQQLSERPRKRSRNKKKTNVIPHVSTVQFNITATSTKPIHNEEACTTPTIPPNPVPGVFNASMTFPRSTNSNFPGSQMSGNASIYSPVQNIPNVFGNPFQESVPSVFLQPNLGTGAQNIRNSGSANVTDNTNHQLAERIRKRSRKRKKKKINVIPHVGRAHTEMTTRAINVKKIHVTNTGPVQKEGGCNSPTIPPNPVPSVFNASITLSNCPNSNFPGLQISGNATILSAVQNIPNIFGNPFQESVPSVFLQPNLGTGAQIICNSGSANVTDNTNQQLAERPRKRSRKQKETNVIPHVSTLQYKITATSTGPVHNEGACITPTIPPNPVPGVFNASMTLPRSTNSNFPGSQMTGNASFLSAVQNIPNIFGNPFQESVPSVFLQPNLGRGTQNIGNSGSANVTDNTNQQLAESLSKRSRKKKKKKKINVIPHVGITHTEMTTKAINVKKISETNTGPVHNEGACITPTIPPDPVPSVFNATMTLTNSSNLNFPGSQMSGNATILNAVQNISNIFGSMNDAENANQQLAERPLKKTKTAGSVHGMPKVIVNNETYTSTCHTKQIELRTSMTYIPDTSLLPSLLERTITPQPEYDIIENPGSASAPGLRVTVTSVDEDLAEEDCNILQQHLEDKILGSAFDPSACFMPRFRGEPVIVSGGLEMCCEDELSLDWLTQTIGYMEELEWLGYPLVIKQKNESIAEFQARTKKTKVPETLRRILHIPAEETPEQILLVTFMELLTELQTKYTGLFDLSMKTEHRLLDKIAQTICERLKVVVKSGPEACENPFTLSKLYRKMHPHFGDFQCILTNLHKTEDEMGLPKTELVESELISAKNLTSAISKIPSDAVTTSTNKFADRISQKVARHIEALDTDLSQDSVEEAARKKIRVEMKKITPYLNVMIKQVLSRHVLMPPKRNFQHARIYGEPCMPSKEVMNGFLRKYRVLKIHRSDRMYNLLKFNVTPLHYADLMAMDGSVIGGAKLVIRASEPPRYIAPQSITAELKAVFGVEHNPDQDDMAEYYNVDIDEALDEGVE